MSGDAPLGSIDTSQKIVHRRLFFVQCERDWRYKKMDNRISITRQKVKRTQTMKHRVLEMQRDDETAPKYDNKNRNLNVDKVSENVTLHPANAETIDAEREARIEAFNTLKKEKNIDKGRKLRADAVDMIGNVVQLSKEYCETHSRSEIVEAYTKAYEVMRENPQEYGEVECCVIHFDETTPHMQVLTSTLDMQNGKNNAKSIYGVGRKDMSMKQTQFAKQMQDKGVDVVRGITRVDSTYTEQQKEFEERFGYKMTRQNEAMAKEMLKMQKALKLGASNANKGRHVMAETLKVIEPHHKIPGEYFGAIEKPDEEPHEISTETGFKQHVRLQLVQLSELLRIASERVLKRAEDQREEARKREYDLQAREEALRQKEQLVSEEQKRVQNDHALYKNKGSLKRLRVGDYVMTTYPQFYEKIEFAVRVKYGSASIGSREKNIEREFENTRENITGRTVQKTIQKEERGVERSK